MSESEQESATKTAVRTSLSAFVTRADGTIEDLGVIAESETPASTKTYIEFFDCPACGAELHINAPEGVYDLECGHCFAQHGIMVGDFEPLRAKARG